MTILASEGYKRPDGVTQYGREEFCRNRFDYRAGQHVVFGGPSQMAGKTTLAFDLLEYVATPELPAYVAVSKPDDKVSTQAGKRLGFRRVSSWPPDRKFNEIEAFGGARWLGLESEQKLIGHGVSSCATCDGFFYRGKKIMVIGGGDSAMEEANFLSRFGSEVTLVHRREEFRASKIMLDRARQNPKIKFLTNTMVEEIYDVSEQMVSGVRLRNNKTGLVWDQHVDGFFLAIGHIPNTKVFKGQIETDADGYIVSKGGARTNIAGVFHAGDVQDRVYRQAVTASGAGCMAAMAVENFLEAEGH